MKWKTTDKEVRLIAKIGERASKLDTACDIIGLTMDITCCHLNGCPLKLAELLAADLVNFTHDIYGISSHLSRRTGKLQHCF